MMVQLNIQYTSSITFSNVSTVCAVGHPSGVCAVGHPSGGGISASPGVVMPLLLYPLPEAQTERAAETLGSGQQDSDNSI
jgi:hypothetical protein